MSLELPSLCSLFLSESNWLLGFLVCVISRIQSVLFIGKLYVVYVHGDRSESDGSIIFQVQVEQPVDENSIYIRIVETF